MLTLDQIKTESNFKLLLIGAPGAGKTCLAASFPGPVLYLDFDDKVDSAALFYKDRPELLKGIEVRQLSRQLNADPLVVMNKIIAEELIPQQRAGEMRWKTIVVDSISAFSAATLNHIINTNPGIKGVETRQGKMPDRPHYGVLLREFSRLIPGLLTLPCNIVMCAHVDTYKDDTTNTIIREAMMDGSYAQKLPQAFKEVWFLYSDKDKIWAQTKPDRQFACLRSQIKGLPSPMDVTNGYSAIAQYIKQ